MKIQTKGKKLKLEDLKCCGNCSKRTFSGECSHQGENVNWKDIIEPDNYCDSWKYDLVKQKKRDLT